MTLQRPAHDSPCLLEISSSLSDKAVEERLMEGNDLVVACQLAGDSFAMISSHAVNPETLH